MESGIVLAEAAFALRPVISDLINNNGHRMNNSACSGISISVTRGKRGERGAGRWEKSGITM